MHTMKEACSGFDRSIEDTPTKKKFELVKHHLEVVYRDGSDLRIPNEHAKTHHINAYINTIRRKAGTHTSCLLKTDFEGAN